MTLTIGTDVALKRLQTVLEGYYSPLSGTSAFNNPSFTAAIATRRLGLLDGMNWDPDDVWELPLEARGGYAGRYSTLLQMTKMKGKIPALAYCDDLWFLLHMAVSGNPTFVTLPNSPQTVLASQAIASTLILTGITQPNAQADAGLAKLIQVVLGNSAAQTTAVVVTINGTDNTGATIVDTCNFSAGTTTPSKTGGGAGATSCTLWSTKYFATITSITTSAQPSGDTVAISAINAFLYTFLSDVTQSTLMSASGEYWDGATFWQLIGIIATKMAFQAQIGKSFKVDIDTAAKARSQGQVSSSPIDGTATAGQLGAMTNLPDNPMDAITTLATRFYVDPYGSAYGTTQILGTLLTEYKWSMDTKAVLGKGADGKSAANFVGRNYYGDGLQTEFTLLANGYTDSELTAYLTQAVRSVRAAFPGPYLPCGQLSAIGNWPASLGDASGKGGGYGLYIDTAGKYQKQTETKVDEREAYVFTQAVQVDLSASGINGAPMRMGLISRVNPNQL